ncbi:MAG TPA: helix-turn-helix domain-containing protein [Solirubrobacterales bacterium]
MLANQRSRLFAATIELVAERGYDGMTVSDVVRLAGVSKASFYQQFNGKEECFVATCDTALREAARAVLRGETAAGGRRERLRAGLAALAELIAAQPKGAKLLLIDVPASTPAIRDHVRRRFGLLEALVRERLGTAEGDKASNPLVAGIVRGIEHHARRCVGAGCPERFQDLVDPLLDWALSFNCEEAPAALAVPAAPVRGSSTAAGDRLNGIGPDEPVDNRHLLLAATLRLASREGYAALTPSRIRRAAGVSRRTFDSNFDDVASCFLAAVEAELAAAFADALRSAPAEADWGTWVYLVLDRFAASLAGAPDITRLAFVESLEAAPAALLWRERLVTQWAEALYRCAPADSRPSPAVAEATVAAIWGSLTDLVAAGRPHLLSGQGARLAYFVLAPAMGARGAAEAIQTAQRAPSYERFALSSR